MTVLAAYNRKNYVYIPLLAVATQFSKTGWPDKVVSAVGTAMHSQVKAALEFLEIFKWKWISTIKQYELHFKTLAELTWHHV